MTAVRSGRRVPICKSPALWRGGSRGSLETEGDRREAAVLTGRASGEARIFNTKTPRTPRPPRVRRRLLGRDRMASTPSWSWSPWCLGVSRLTSLTRRLQGRQAPGGGGLKLGAGRSPPPPSFGWSPLYLDVSAEACWRSAAGWAGGHRPIPCGGSARVPPLATTVGESRAAVAVTHDRTVA